MLGTTTLHAKAWFVWRARRVRVRRGHGARLATLVAVCGLGLLASARLLAVDEFESLADPEQQARYLAIIHEVRCLTCLNRSIAESETPLAHDLRREIRDLIAAGKTDQEVADFLVQRYGDFALYRPPLRPRTWALWFGPVVFLGIGALVFAGIVRRRMRQPIDDDDAPDNDDGDETDGVTR
jgi:cytochrome c-type biogenesis protein CcmH